MSYLSIGLAMAGRGCLIIGGGPTALAKVRAVEQSKARIAVVSPEFIPEFAALAGVELRRRRFVPADLDGMVVGIAATDDQSVNHSFACECRARGVLCNVVDDPAHCDFIVPSMLHRGPLIVSVLTSGAAPALAKRLREGLERSFPDDYGEYVSYLGQARARALKLLPDARQRHRLAERLASEAEQQRFCESTPTQREDRLAELLAEAQRPGSQPRQ